MTMEKRAFNVSVGEWPAKRLVGMYVHINMYDGSIKECPALWEKFALRAAEVDALNGELRYGVSSDMEENGGMKYWAAVESAAPVPEGMGVVELDARKYAVCSVEKLEDIGPAYFFIYDDWAKEQTRCAVDFTKPSFELYREKDGGYAIEIYAPLV